jgi:phospholipase/carboxylesterase
MAHQTKQTIGELNCVVVTSAEDTNPSAAVILCHGFGASSTDLVSLASELMEADPRLQKAAYIFPGAPLELDPMFESRAWWMIDIEKIQRLMEQGQTREMKKESPDRLPACREMINQVIAFAKSEYSLDAKQVVVGGFSQGSMLATDVALHHEEPLGGLVVWSGALINEAVWKEQAQKQTSIPVIQSHGSVDPILPVTGAHDLRDMLMGAGHKVQYFEFHGPHTITVDGLRPTAQLIVDIVEAD